MDNHCRWMSILDSLDDCVIECGSNKEPVRANTFIMVQNCELFRMVYEDMVDSKDGDRIFEAPNVSSRVMQLLVNLLHKKINTHDIVSVDDILDIFEAQRYLNCSYKKSKLSNQLWELVRSLNASPRSMDTMVKTAGHLLETHLREFLSKARVVSNMRFHSFQKIFRDVDMTPSIAKSCMTECMGYFSPLLLLHALVSVTTPGLRFHVVLECISMYRVGCYFHPDEYLLALHMLGQYRSTSQLEIPPYVLDISRAILDACHNVNSPSCLSKAGGSLITIQGKPRASFFIHLHKVRCKMRMTFQNNVALVHRSDDVLECRFLLGKLGDYAHTVDEAHVRIIYLGEVDGKPVYSETTEEWIHTHHVDHDDHDAIDIRHVMESSSVPVTYIRIDIFWVHDPVDL